MRDYDIAFSMGSRCGCSQALRAARLQLTVVVKNLIKTALSLIGVEAPERM